MRKLLAAPEAYWNLTPAAKAEICNGCGPAGGGWKSLFIPNHLLGADIEEACNIHDFRYKTGQSEADRLAADEEFLCNMLRIVNSLSHETALLASRRSLALLYYSEVRDRGSKFFWVDKVRPEEAVA
jgi:hypothetical protein